jgi:recombination protein RecA
LRKLTGAIARSTCMVIFTNQIREKIGVMFGSPETQPGGRALKFYASVRIDLRRIGQVKDREDVVGSRVKATVVKNKVAPPFRKVQFDILFNEGISREGDVLDLAIEHRVVDKAGAWFSFNGERLGQGRERVRLFLRENKELLKQIEQLVVEKLGPSFTGSASRSDEDGDGDADGDADDDDAPALKAARSRATG